ncbi:decarboxylase [Candidatus Micrarchaeota archaeon]|jgi:ornithine decarboxylase|nr:decarboxylase [Candidatus Micrarchaeota archaeon]
MAKFILHKSKVFEQYNLIKKKADLVSYSFKTNQEVGEILEIGTDCFFSIHTIESLEKIKDKKRVWFFAQAWDNKEIEKLLSLGVESFVIDNLKDLELIFEILKEKDIKINLLLRMRLKEHTIHTGKHFVFGMYSETINNKIKEIRENSEFNKKINKLGIHFHRKTQNVSEWNLKQELEDILDKKTLENIDYINIGGGLPSIYKNFSSDILIDIFDKIKETKEWFNKNNIKMIIEPGRFIAAPCIELETSIKNIYNDNIIVNASVYNSAMDTFIAHIRLLIKDELNTKDKDAKPYTIKGCTPDSLDIFRYRIYLKDPKIGDKIIFLNAGAYNFHTNFCNLPKIQTEIKD